MARTKSSLKNSDFFGPRQALTIWKAAKLAKRPFFEVRGMPLTYDQTIEALYSTDVSLCYPYELADTDTEPFWATVWAEYPNAITLKSLSQDEWSEVRRQWRKQHLYASFNDVAYLKDTLDHCWIDPSGQIGKTGNFSDKYPGFIHSTLKEIKEKLPFINMVITIYNDEGKAFLTAQVDKDVRYTLAHHEVMSVYPVPVEHLFMDSLIENPAPWIITRGQVLPELMVQKLYQKVYDELDSILLSMQKIVSPSSQSEIPALD